MKRYIFTLLLLLTVVFCVHAGTTVMIIGGSGSGSGTLGYEDVGGTEGSFPGKCNQWTADASFTATKGYFYNNSANTSSFKMAIWSDDGGTPGAPSAELGCSDTTAGDNVANWDELTFTGEEQVSITNGTKYWVCFIIQTGSSANYYKYTTDTPPNTHNNDNNQKAGCDVSGGEAATARKISMYVSSD